MTRKRVKPHTVLDDLEAQGIIPRDLCANLRLYFKRKSPKGVVLNTESLLRNLMGSLDQSVKPTSRQNLQRDYLLKLEHDYYVSIGERSPVEKVATLRGWSVRTVSSALRRATTPPIMTPGVRAPWLSDTLDKAHFELGKRKVGKIHR